MTVARSTGLHAMLRAVACISAALAAACSPRTTGEARGTVTTSDTTGILVSTVTVQAPLELPAQSGLYYFRLLRQESARSWQQIQVEKSAVIRWTDHEADYAISLYMTVPQGTTTATV